jgi:membrane protease YdiL (CAAX protease family)
MSLLFAYQGLLLLIIVLIVPVLAVLNSAATTRILNERPDLRWAFYQQGILFQWLLVALIGLALWWQGVGLSAIGLWSVWRLDFWLSFVGLSLLSLLVYRWYRPGAVVSRRVNKLYRHVAHYLPVDHRSFHWGVPMALTAGVCEELIFRGYLYHQLLNWMPVWLAVILVNVVFAVTHYATGLLNMLGSFLLGLLFSSLFLLTGDLWLSMWLHALIDLLAMTLYPLANQSLQKDQQAS